MTNLKSAFGRLIFLLISTVLGWTGASALNLTGIPESGSPAFYNDVKVTLHSNNGTPKLNNGTLKLRGKKDFMFDDGSNPFWQGGTSKYSVNIYFNKVTGAFAGGTLSLKGRIDGLGIPRNTVLVTADIIDWNITEDVNLWGFKTDNIVCSPLLLVACTTTESIYVELDDPFTQLDPTAGRFTTTGTAQTTVPVPAAAWFFGSALGLLGWIKRNSGVGFSDGVLRRTSR